MTLWARIKAWWAGLWQDDPQEYLDAIERLYQEDFYHDFR